MPSAFDKFIDRIIAFFSHAPERARAAEPPPAKMKLSAMSGIPIEATDCRVCGLRRAKPEYYDQFCSYECEQRMADSLDAWHDQFQERFGDD